MCDMCMNELKKRCKEEEEYRKNLWESVRK